MPAFDLGGPPRQAPNADHPYDQAHPYMTPTVFFMRIHATLL